MSFRRPGKLAVRLSGFNAVKSNRYFLEGQVTAKFYSRWWGDDLRSFGLPFVQIEVDNSNNIKLSNDFDFSINDNIIKIQTKEVNKEISKLIKEIEQVTTINNINIINSSLEDAFLKLTNK